MTEHLAAAYYPEHVDEGRWAQDVARMKRCGVGAVRILEFAWSRMEPADGQYDFDWVHRAMRLFEAEGLQVIPCTPSAAPPAWITRVYPETLLMTPTGQRACHGGRRHYCPTSTRYRAFAARMAARMQHELAGYSNVVAWQIDNELGFNRCYCPECDDAFRCWAQTRYGTLAALNDAWGGAFWSQDHGAWEHLVVPRGQGPEGGAMVSPEMALAGCQFYSDTITSFLADQVRALRDAGCRAPISTNFMGNFDQIDYWAAARQVDFVGFDTYEFIHTDATFGFAHNLMRGLKRHVPYWTFENGVENHPGFDRVRAIEAFAHGEDVHTFFRWDSCRFGHEQDLKGLVDWSGTETHKVAEVAELQADLQRLRALELPAPEPRVAIVFSYQNYWATARYYGSYWNEVNDYYRALADLGLICDCVQAGDALDCYAVVLCPGLSLATDGDVQNLRDYVAGGGVLFAGRKCLAKTESGSYRDSPHPALPDVFGMRVAHTETDSDFTALGASIYRGTFPKRAFGVTSPAGLPDSQTSGWFEVLEASGADVLYTYADSYFRGQPLATAHAFGKGRAFYLGAMLDRVAMQVLMRRVLAAGGLTPLADVPPGACVVQCGNRCVATNHSLGELAITFHGDVNPLCGVACNGRQIVLPPMSYGVLEIQ